MQGERTEEEDVAVRVHSFLSDAKHCQALETEDDEPQPLLSGAPRQQFSSTQDKHSPPRFRNTKPLLPASPGTI